MEITAENKLMTNNTSGINKEIKMTRKRPETVTRFKYLGLVVSDEGSKPDILSRTAQTTAALTRLKPVWNDRSVPLGSKIQLITATCLKTYGNKYISDQSRVIDAEQPSDKKSLNIDSEFMFYVKFVLLLLSVHHITFSIFFFFFNFSCFLRIKDACYWALSKRKK